MQNLHSCFSLSTLPGAIVAIYVAAQQRRAIMTPFKTISEKLAAWRRYRDAVRELSQLSDRDLSDIGIRRGDIESIVRQSMMEAAD
jgi:uncharacterized protein YjiS (DUF1127 family)